MKYGFTRGFARIVIALGWLMMLAGLALAILALYVVPRYPLWGGPAGAGHQEIAAAALAVVAGLLIGAVTIVLGQLVLVFLDIRARLVRIDRRLRRREEASPSDPPWAERLRPR